MSAKDFKILEITFAKAYGEIEKFDYCEDITEKLQSNKLINKDQCQRIRSSETSGNRNR